MAKTLGRCFVCSTDKELKDIPNLYTNGSEGTVLCEMCELNMLGHLSMQIDLVNRAKGTEDRTVGHCAVCDSSQNLKEIRNFGLGGSGGKTTLCHTCEMDIISYIRTQANLSARTRKGGWLSAKKPNLVKSVS